MTHPIVRSLHDVTDACAGKQVSESVTLCLPNGQCATAKVSAWRTKVKAIRAKHMPSLASYLPDKTITIEPDYVVLTPTPLGQRKVKGPNRGDRD